jgi:hypothetical protein
MEKFANMNYYINAIRNEQDREIGASRRYGPYVRLEYCMKDAEIFNKHGFLYIEVMQIVDGKEEIYCEYEN